MNTTYNKTTEQKPCHELPFMDQNEIKAIKICLNSFNNPINVLEWGSGKSTLFFSSLLQQGSSWLAFEHDPNWFQEMKTKIESHPSSCASIVYIQPDRPFDGLTDGDFTTFHNYVLAPAQSGNTFDFILVDGRARIECLAIGWNLLKENGVMVLHDAQRKEYSSGIPQDCFSIRLTNPNVLVEGPISTLFMVKQHDIAKNLAESLAEGLDNNAQLETTNIVEFNNSASSKKAFSTSLDLATWDSLKLREQIKLYAGDIPDLKQYEDYIGLSITKEDYRHILHDLTEPFPIPDNSVDTFQAEDVLEHIQYEKLPSVLDEIFRVLKPGGLFRLSVPDYGCDVLQERSQKNASGELVFDPGGGGTKENPGHVWFPRIDNVRDLIEKSSFARHGSADYLHYYNMDGSFVTKPVDYSKGYVGRTPDFDERTRSPYRPMSMIIDLVKMSKSETDNQFKSPPKTFFIETTLGCDLMCPECAIGGGFIKRSKGMMNFEQFKIIADKIRPYANYVFLFIWGEPLLNPDIFKIISYTAQFAPCNISTNCKSLTKEKAEELIISGVRDIIVSIDGVSQEVYEQYRVGGDVDKAFHALAMLSKINRQHGNKVNIFPQFVVFNHNQHEMAHFTEKCAEMGLSPTFKAPYIRKGESRYQYSENPTYQRPHFQDISQLRTAMTSCPDPREVFTVLVDGSVVVCCNDHNGTTSFGNIFSQTVMEIWNSPAYLKCRTDIVSGNASSFCTENCMVWFLETQKNTISNSSERYQQLLLQKSKMLDEIMSHRLSEETACLGGNLQQNHKHAIDGRSNALKDSFSTKSNHCLFLNTYYAAFLESHYQKYPDLSSEPYLVQKQSLHRECFGDSDFYSESLVKAGWDAEDLIVNCVPLQQAWARENNFHGEGLNVVVEQLRRAQPDVVYIQDLNICTEDFLGLIRPYTRLIVGQIASPIPPRAHLSGIDIIVSSFPHFVDRFRQTRTTSYYQPLAFELRVLEQTPKYENEVRPIECSFVGGLSPHHNRGYGLLEYLAREVPIHFWGYGVGTLPADSAIIGRHHGEVWGEDMFRILSSSKITVNRHIDVAENNANNMRLFEATGCGALLITDYKDNLNNLFEIGKEVVAYRSPEECVALIRYYLAHPDEAAVIAKAGQARTLREHTYRLRMEQTAEILERHLRYKREHGKLQIPDRISDGYQEITQAEITQTMEAAWKNPTIPLQQRALVQKQLDQMYHGEIAVPFQVLANIITPVIRNGDTLLEIGCASGYYYEILEYLLNKRLTYTGVDYSEAMIELAKEYYPAAAFFAADGANLFFADRQFHTVISSCVLLHVPNWRQHVFETVRVAEKYVVVSRTPVCRNNPTRYMKKHAYGVETVELLFNEAEIVREFLLHGLELTNAIQYYSNPADDEYQVTYLFRRP
jgi:MoaA/NifB/PqqE/SkfB family radical SAM enzyme/ubiquinone/menaquinone biosynthesis C-methylase UbiE